MELVRLEPGEGRRLRALRIRALRADPEAFGSSLSETEARPMEAWTRQLHELPTWAAVRGDEDVGMVRLVPGGDDAAELISMWVAPEARGHGIGEALVYAVIAWAKEAGKRAVTLEVHAANAPATRLYARLGFSRLGASGEGTHRMQRLL